MDTRQFVLNFAGYHPGTCSAVKIPDAPQHRIPNLLTIEAWINCRGETAGAGIVSKLGPNGAGYAVYLDGRSGFILQLQQERKPIVFHSTNRTAFTCNAWHHLAVAYVGNMRVVYLNGEYLGDTTIEEWDLNYEPSELLIGAKLAGKDQFSGFIGQIAEVRLWNVERTEQEIKLNMRRRLRGTEPGLVGYWPLNEGSGTLVKDLTRYASHGTAINASWSQSDLELQEPLLPAEKPSADHNPAETAAANQEPAAGGTPANQGTHQSSYAEAILADKPLAYWKLDETDGTVASDCSGNGHHGTVKGGVKRGQPGAGPALRSSAFDGKSGHIEVTGGPWGGGSKLSVVAWMYLPELRGDTQWHGKDQIQTIIAGKDGLADCSFNGTSLMTRCLATPHFTTLLSKPDALAAGRWLHITVTQAPFDLRIYVDGQLVNSPKDQIGYSTINPVQQLFIGRTTRQDTLNEQFLFGMLSDVAIFDRVLSPERLLAYIAAAKQPESAKQPEPGQVGTVEAALKECQQCNHKGEELEKKLAEREQKCAAYEKKLDELEQAETEHEKAQAALQQNVDELLARLDRLENELSSAPARVEEKAMALENRLQELEQKLQQAQSQTPAPTPKKPDNLSLIEGIGPKITELLVKAGIRSFTDLAKAEVGRLKEILAGGGKAFQTADPTSWPEQARLKAEGRNDELKALQDKLQGGRTV